jgi:transcriptional regulator with XRE-family HTH domain
VPKEAYRRPELGEAVAWLRDRARLTQRAAAEAAGVSRIYLQKIEAGERAPATDKLAALLDVLGSNQEELENLLASRPWAAAPPRQRVRARARAKPADFIRAAEAALAAGPWSSRVATAPDDDLSRTVAGELAELRDHYVNLPREQQEALLGEARRRRYRRWAPAPRAPKA